MVDPAPPAPPADPGRHSAASLTVHAIDLTAEVGIDRLTVRGLARRAGLYPAAVTHHLGDLEAIQFRVADEVVARIEIPPPPLSADRWRSWLLALAESGYGVIARYPGVYTFIARTGPSSPSQVRIIDATMQVLSNAGLDDYQAALVYGTFIAHVGASADLAALFELHAEGRPERRAEFTLSLVNVAGLHPGLRIALPTFAHWDHEAAFRFGLDLLLDGIEARITASA